MNLIEALKTGKKVRRPCFSKDEYFGFVYYPVFDGKLVFFDQNGNTTIVALDIADLYADDWEGPPQPEKSVRVTQKDIMDALTKADFLQKHDDVDVFLEALGFSVDEDLE